MSGFRAVFARLSRRRDPEMTLAARAFDARWYLATYPDVAAFGDDPLEHFMAHGWREGRDPSRTFSVTAYLAAFPQVADAGLNPLVHYLRNGRPKVFAPESKLGFRFEVIEGLKPVAERLASAHRAQVDTDDPLVLATAVSSARDRLGRVHVTFSHDDFSANVGGLQSAIRREAFRVAQGGRDHLHFCCARPWMVIRTSREPEPLEVIWNGRRIGAFALPDILTALQACAGPEASARSFAIHSLLGHDPEEVLQILGVLGLRDGVFWLHDFASLCAGFHLMRNDVVDCGAPPPRSAACDVCIYGPSRERHLTGHARLFAGLNLTVAAPSSATLDLWRAATDLLAVCTLVLPHATLVPRGPAKLPPRNRPFKIAFAGLAVPHKGWPIFRALAARFANDPRYVFVHLGVQRDNATPIDFETVAAGADQPDAMRVALERAQVDAVLVWPLCRETFSFVAYEAVAAGCAVITSPDTGNVAAFVGEGDHGLVMADEAALTAAFTTGEILQLSRTVRRPMLYDLAYSALTLDLPPGDDGAQSGS